MGGIVRYRGDANYASANEPGCTAFNATSPTAIVDSPRPHTLHLKKVAERIYKVMYPHMVRYFSRAVHEIYECPVAHALESNLAKSVPYNLPVRCSSLPLQDHGAQIDAAIAITERLQEVDPLAVV